MRADGLDAATERVVVEAARNARLPEARAVRRMLDDAYARAAETVASYTDEAALVEAMGAEVQVVPDDPTNMKVTTPADIEIAAALLPP